MANKKGNNLTVKTRQALTAAYIELLEEKPTQKISITEICTRADLTRPTFYAHFQSKDDILIETAREILQPIYREFRAYQFNAQSSSAVQLAQNFFRIWKANATLYRLLKIAGVEHLVRAEYQTTIHRIYVNGAEGSTLLDSSMGEYVISFLVGGPFLILDQWMERGMKEAPEEMGEFISMLLDSASLERVYEKYL